MWQFLNLISSLFRWINIISIYHTSLSQFSLDRCLYMYQTRYHYLWTGVSKDDGDAWSWDAPSSVLTLRLSTLSGAGVEGRMEYNTISDSNLNINIYKDIIYIKRNKTLYESRHYIRTKRKAKER